MRRRHWPTQQIHPVDWITSLKLKPIEFKWNTKKPESDCRASRYLKDNDKLKSIKVSRWRQYAGGDKKIFPDGYLT